MNKYLITGFSGFVSKYFLDYLANENIKVEVLGVDLLSPKFKLNEFKNVKCIFEKVNLLDKAQVDNLIYQFQPHYIIHLASYSSVAFSWKDPVTSYNNNTNIFLNLLEQVRQLELNCRILSVGSSEEYGNVKADDIPLTEKSILNPCSPYAAARVSQEQLSKIYIDGYGLDIVMTRSFNHIGPGQRDIFAISSFARQIVEMKMNNIKKGTIYAGDISIIRDIIDVRDVVCAYHKIIEKGKTGEVYNVCGGVGLSLLEIINKLAKIVNIVVKVEKDENILRPVDNKIIIGSNEKLKKEIGWQQEYDLDKSLKDILLDWEQRL